jgi:hypothetical protein
MDANDSSVDVRRSSCSTFKEANLELEFSVLLVILRFLCSLDRRVATSNLLEIAITELSQLGNIQLD